MRLTSLRRRAGSHDHRSNQEQGGRNLAEDVGRRYHLVAGETDSYIDLLFYSLRLRRYTAVELKNEEFKPEYAGKLGLCIAAVDDELRGLNRLLLRQGLRRARARRRHALRASGAQTCEARPRCRHGGVRRLHQHGRPDRAADLVRAHIQHPAATGAGGGHQPYKRECRETCGIAKNAYHSTL